MTRLYKIIFVLNILNSVHKILNDRNIKQFNTIIYNFPNILVSKF